MLSDIDKFYAVIALPSGEGHDHKAQYKDSLCRSCLHFTAGGEDCTVNMWNVDTELVQISTYTNCSVAFIISCSHNKPFMSK